MAENYKMLVTPNQVRKYENSEHAQKARDLFKRYQGKNNIIVPRYEYCCMRDHIFTIIHFGNANRSGVSVNMTVAEFKEAQKMDSGMRGIDVKEHKTKREYGAAKVTLLTHQYLSLIHI